VPSEDQSAACLVVTHTPAALEQGAPSTESDLKMLIFIPASFMLSLSHLAIVEEVTVFSDPRKEQTSFRFR